MNMKTNLVYTVTVVDRKNGSFVIFLMLAGYN